MNHPRILGIGTASALLRLTQEQTFHRRARNGGRGRIAQVVASVSDVMYHLFELYHDREELFWTQRETLFPAIALIRYAAWNSR